MRIGKTVGMLVVVAGCTGQVANLGGTGADGGASDRANGGDSGTTGTTTDGSISSPACPTGYVCTPAQTPGATSIASQIQETATSLASDGTTLFWASDDGGPLSSMPVEGGTITTIVPAPVGQVVAVDSANVYYIPNSGVLTRSPKAGGGTPAPVGGATSPTEWVTVLGSSAYWLESNPLGGAFTIESAPLQGGAATVIATLSVGVGPGASLGVTGTTVFVASLGGNQLASFPIGSGVPDGGTPAPVGGVSQGCSFIVSDTNAIYCGSYEASLLSIASNGTPTTLGMVLGEGTTAGANGLAFDDTDVYWVDAVTVGTIMKAPKGGGTATLVARDTSPIAIAVDANAIYWSDESGNIMRLPK